MATEDISRKKPRRIGNDEASTDESRQGQIGWRACYNKMQAQGLFAGNKIRKKRRKN